MKKLLLVLALILVLSLSGCQESYYQECINNGGQEVFTKGVNRRQCVMPSEQDDFYTKEEVDEMLSDLAEGILYGDIHTLALVEDDYYSEEDFDEWNDMLRQHLEENYQPLQEECDIDCVIDQVDYDITVTTIAQIDLLIYGYDNEETLTEEEQFVYDFYIQLREDLYNSIN